jgi:hypothetical protein
VTTLTVARYRFSGEQTSLIFIDVFMKVLKPNHRLSESEINFAQKPHQSNFLPESLEQ